MASAQPEVGKREDAGPLRPAMPLRYPTSDRKNAPCRPPLTMRLPGIDIVVSNDLPAGYDGIPGPRWLADAVRQGLARVLPQDAAGQVSLLIADDAAIRELNRAYRGRDETTDVLSFSAQYAGPWAGPDDPPATAPAPPAGPDFFPLPDGEPPPLGDIAISLPQARRQAEAAGVPLKRELALLLVHGALHLLGHDHYDHAERAAMQALERAALADLFGDSPP